MKTFDDSISLSEITVDTLNLKKKSTISIMNSTINKIKKIEADTIILKGIKKLKHIDNIRCRNLIITQMDDLISINKLIISNKLNITFSPKLESINFLESDDIDLIELHKLSKIQTIKTSNIQIMGCTVLDTIESLRSKRVDIGDHLPDIKSLNTKFLYLIYLDAYLNPTWSIDYSIELKDVIIQNSGGHSFHGQYTLNENSNLVKL